MVMVSDRGEMLPVVVEESDELTAALRTRLQNLPVRTVSISSLKLSDSVRLAGMNDEHIQALAAADGVLPPIIVHLPGMRVIDGAHRVRAAASRGLETTEARMFDGTEAEALVLAVQANAHHGLPLSLADRKAAAVRLIAHYPQWSDRGVALIAGVSDKTVGTIRRRVCSDTEQVHARVGRDGRLRPVDPEQGRRRAAELIRDNPAAPLREIASRSGISPETARKVRERLRSDDGAVSVLRQAAQGRGTGLDGDLMAGVIVSKLQNLRQDPTLRFTESGRFLLRLFDFHLISPADRRRLLESVPQHSVGVVVEVAKACASRWLQLAEQLECQVDDGE